MNDNERDAIEEIIVRLQGRIFSREQADMIIEMVEQRVAGWQEAKEYLAQNLELN